MRLLRFAKRYAVASVGAAYAFTFGLGSEDHRRLIKVIASHFGHRDNKLPVFASVDADLVSDQNCAVVLPEPHAADGNMTLYELLVLAQVVRSRAPRTIFEIGTFDGRTTVTLAANAPENSVTHTLDLPSGTETALPLVPWERKYVEKPGSGARIKNSPFRPRIEQHLGDSATFNFAPFAADLVLVDGSHSYEYALNDSRRALAMLPPNGGTIVWHDYGEWDGVTRALDELSGTADFAGLRHIRGTTLVLLDRAKS